jgi:hypothetical protein
VRAFEMSTASAAMGGTPALFKRTVEGIFASLQAGRIRVRSLAAREEMVVDLVCRYARM